MCTDGDKGTVGEGAKPPAQRVREKSSESNLKRADSDDRICEAQGRLMGACP